MSIVIRPAEMEDCAQLLELMHELAVFEHYRDQFKISESDLQERGFLGVHPQFMAHVAEETENQNLSGMAVTYLRPDFLGRPRLVMKELFVQEQCRGKSIGEKLIHAVCREAVLKKCTNVMWTVADWNEKGRFFYEKLGAEQNIVSMNYNIPEQKMRDIAVRPGNPVLGFSVNAASSSECDEVFEFIKRQYQPEQTELPNKATFKAAMEKDSGFTVLVCRNDLHEICGVAICTIQEFHFSARPKILLENLVVVDSINKFPIVHQLIQSLCDQGIQKNACGVGISFDHQNYEALLNEIGAVKDLEWLNYSFPRSVMAKHSANFQSGLGFSHSRMKEHCNF